MGCLIRPGVYFATRGGGRTPRAAMPFTSTRNTCLGTAQQIIAMATMDTHVREKTPAHTICVAMNGGEVTSEKSNANIPRHDSDLQLVGVTIAPYDGRLDAGSRATKKPRALSNVALSVRGLTTVASTHTTRGFVQLVRAKGNHEGFDLASSRATNPRCIGYVTAIDKANNAVSLLIY